MRLLLSAIVVLGLTASAAIPQEKEPKTPKLMDNPTDKEAETAYAKWLATELPKVGKPFDLMFQIWDGIKLHQNKKKNFNELLDKILKLYSRGGSDDDATIDVCNALAELFGYPLTGANLISCQDGLKNVPKLSGKDYEKIRKAVEEMKAQVKKDP
jgi:hypothetical protein